MLQAGAVTAVNVDVAYEKVPKSEYQNILMYSLS